jgi:hypothetical protein
MQSVKPFLKLIPAQNQSALLIPESRTLFSPVLYPPESKMLTEIRIFFTAENPETAEKINHRIGIIQKKPHA